MADLPLTAFDVAILLIVGISGLLALVRGATREALTMAAWVGALVVAYYGFGHVREFAQKTIETALGRRRGGVAGGVRRAPDRLQDAGVRALGSGLGGWLLHGRPDRRDGVRRGARRGDRLRALSRHECPGRSGRRSRPGSPRRRSCPMSRTAQICCRACCRPDAEEDEPPAPCARPRRDVVALG